MNPNGDQETCSHHVNSILITPLNNPRITMQANQSSSVPEYLAVYEAAAKRNADLLSSLPKEIAPITDLYKYQGHWFGAFNLQGALSFQNHFRAKDSDVFLVTCPKSGTTWLKALVFATLNREHHVVGSSEHPLLVSNPHEVVPFIDLGIYGKIEDPDLSCFKSPRLFSTHLPYVFLPPSIKKSASKIVYLCRNPKDTFISSWHFLNKLSLQQQTSVPMDEEFEQFCRGVSLYGPYWDHVSGYRKKSLEMPENVLFLKFEDLKEKPSLYLEKLAEFLGCPFSLEEEASGVPDQILRLCSFDNLSTLEVNKNGKSLKGVENNVFFRRGEVGDWKNYLTAEMTKKIDGLVEEKFKAFGLQI